MSVTRSAQRGAALLDAQNPGWYTRINPATIDLNSASDCILGQIYGDFFYGLTALKLSLRAISVWGAIPELFSTVFNGSKYGFIGWFWNLPELENAWREEIAARRLKDYQREMEALRIAKVERLVKKPSFIASVLTTVTMLFA